MSASDRARFYATLGPEALHSWNDGSLRITIRSFRVNVDRGLVEVYVAAAEHGKLLDIDGHLVFANPPTKHDGVSDPLTVLQAIVTDVVRRQVGR